MREFLMQLRACLACCSLLLFTLQSVLQDTVLKCTRGILAFIVKDVDFTFGEDRL